MQHANIQHPARNCSGLASTIQGAGGQAEGGQAEGGQAEGGRAEGGRRARPQAALIVCAAVLAGGLAACSATEPEPPPSSNPAAGCVDDSKRCIELRGQALKGMMADAKRGWVTRHETPSAYATGVKLFAYRGKKAEMTCAELAHGREETRSMPQTLKPGSVPGMNDSRLAQVRDLSGQVNKELAREFDRACVTPTQAKRGFETRVPKV